MKKHSTNARTNSRVSVPSKKPRLLKKYLGELRALYNEAVAIFNELLIDPSVDLVCGLCTRFCVLQENFFLRYREAQAYAISALGLLEARIYFP